MTERPRGVRRWRGPVEEFVQAHPRWTSVLVVLGALFVGTVILSVFTPLGRRPERIWATAMPPVGSPAFVLAVAGSVHAPHYTGGRAEVLNNGVRFVPAMLRDIRTARRSVNFMAYMWEAGAMSDTLVAALEERARAGVAVRVVLDAWGAYKIPTGDIRRLEAAGVRVHTFRPLQWGKLTRFHRRNHRRAIVIDGEVGYTGGAAVSDKWLGDAANPEQWRDTMVRVTGPLAESLQAAFAQLWASSYGEILVGPAFYPEDAAVRTRGDAISEHINVISSPADDSHPLRKVFWLSFMAARERLWITNSYFVPDEHIREALKNRARAGVDVRILLPNQHTDAAVVRYAGHKYFEELLTAGVKIYEYQPTMMHAKQM
ncbi:MAG: phospholipase D-like domain-containing protein, partial [Gemmatimonadota bacterium]|nr:phospholipase D-like domain-containing protein [Gemmatimonadota bacterium]